MDELFTVDELANWLRVHPASVRRWLKTGQVDAIKAGSSWRATRPAIEAYLRDRQLRRKEIARNRHRASAGQFAKPAVPPA